VLGLVAEDISFSQLKKYRQNKLVSMAYLMIAILQNQKFI